MRGKYSVWKDPGMWTPTMIWWRIRVRNWARKLTEAQKREMRQRIDKTMDKIVSPMGYAQYVEYGTRRVPPTPFLKTAVDEAMKEKP